MMSGFWIRPFSHPLQ